MARKWSVGLSLLLAPVLTWGMVDMATTTHGYAAVGLPAPANPESELGQEPEPTPTPTPSAKPSAKPTPSAPPKPKPTLNVNEKPTAPPPPPGPPPPAQPQAPGVDPSVCVTSGGPIDRPSRFQVYRMKVDAPLSTVGKDKDGNPDAPPLSRMFDTAWYSGSPKAGSNKGNVIINVHSYASGNALGNVLHDRGGSGGLRAGDVIKVTGENGKVACYRYRERIKFDVASYDRRSGIYHNANGRPQLAIMTCWDRDPRTGVYNSRILFYADLIPA